MGGLKTPRRRKHVRMIQKWDNDMEEECQGVCKLSVLMPTTTLKPPFASFDTPLDNLITDFSAVRISSPAKGVTFGGGSTGIHHQSPATPYYHSSTPPVIPQRLSFDQPPSYVQPPAHVLPNYIPEGSEERPYVHYFNQ